VQVNSSLLLVCSLLLLHEICTLFLGNNAIFLSVVYHKQSSLNNMEESNCPKYVMDGFFLVYSSITPVFLGPITSVDNISLWRLETTVTVVVVDRFRMFQVL